MPRPHRSKPWPVKDVSYVEVALSDLTSRHLHIKSDHGIRIVVANEEQLPLAPAPTTPLVGGLPSFNLVTDLIIGKYTDHLPLYRQQNIFQRNGISWFGVAIALPPKGHEERFEEKAVNLSENRSASDCRDIVRKTRFLRFIAI